MVGQTLSLQHSCTGWRLLRTSELVWFNQHIPVIVTSDIMISMISPQQGPAWVRNARHIDEISEYFLISKRQHSCYDEKIHRCNLFIPSDGSSIVILWIILKKGEKRDFVGFVPRSLNPQYKNLFLGKNIPALFSYCVSVKDVCRHICEDFCINNVSHLMWPWKCAFPLSLGRKCGEGISSGGGWKLQLTLLSL